MTNVRTFPGGDDARSSSSRAVLLFRSRADDRDAGVGLCAARRDVLRRDGDGELRLADRAHHGRGVRAAHPEPGDLPVSDDEREPIDLANEFAAVTVRVVETGNGVRLRIESPRLGRSIDLDPLELEALTWQSHDLFTGCSPTRTARRTSRDDAGRQARPGRRRRLGHRPRRPRRVRRRRRALVGVLERDAAKCAALRTRRAGHARRRRATRPTPTANDAAVAAVVDRHGGLDVLVSCVGIFDFYRGVRDLARDELLAAFDELFHVNVASLLVSRAGRPRRARRRAAGSVVLTCSTSSFYPGRGGVLYVASKFAVRGLVVALAHELAPGRPRQRRRARAARSAPTCAAPPRSASPARRSATARAARTSCGRARRCTSP